MYVISPKAGFIQINFGCYNPNLIFITLLDSFTTTMYLLDVNNLDVFFLNLTDVNTKIITA